MIRDATPADHPELAAIYREASLWNDDDREALLAEPAYLEWAPQAGGVVRVAVDEAGGITGFAEFTLGGDGAAELLGLFVAPAQMRRGIGLALVDDACARCTREAGRGGATELRVVAGSAALAFYRAAGFVGDEPAPTPLGPAWRLARQL